jgi:hypothetical protein
VSEHLVVSAVFKLLSPSISGWRVRFPSTSAIADARVIGELVPRGEHVLEIR